MHQMKDKMLQICIRNKQHKDEWNKTKSKPASFSVTYYIQMLFSANVHGIETKYRTR